MPARTPGRRGLLRAAVALAACVGIGLYIYLKDRPSAQAAIGVVRETEIRVAPEIGGTLASILIVPGQSVRKGEKLFVLDAPELAAAVDQAKANEAAAKADRANVYAGMRIEQRDSLQRSIAIAQSNLTLANQEYVRAAALSKSGDTSRQNRDEAAAAVDKARAALALAQAQYAAAIAGPTQEQLAIADTKLAASTAAVEVAQAQFDKTRPVAPADGVVAVQIAELGEAVRAGEPVLTIAVAREDWFSFTLREDRLQGLGLGSHVDLVDSRGARLPAAITELRPLGEFATWRATRAVGDHDSNTFLLRADPLASTSAVQPGMSVWIVPGTVTTTREGGAPHDQAFP